MSCSGHCVDLRMAIARVICIRDTSASYQVSLRENDESDPPIELRQDPQPGRIVMGTPCTSHCIVPIFCGIRYQSRPALLKMAIAGMQQVGPRCWGKWRVVRLHGETADHRLCPLRSQTPTALCGHILPTPARLRAQRLASRTVRVRAEEQQGDGPRLSFKPSQRAVSSLFDLSALSRVVCPRPPHPLFVPQYPHRGPRFSPAC